MFIGFVTLGDTITFPVLTVSSSNVPINSTTTPTYRVYGNAALQAGGTGSLTEKETGTVTGATNASPIVITSVAHGLTTGMRVTVADVGGNTNANGDFNITVATADTFSLDGTTGNSAYTSGGEWNTSGLYSCSVEALQGNGYAAGHYYDVLVVAKISGNVSESLYRFGVI